MKKDFVVYAYLRENGTFYYIGKGRPRRPYSCGKRARTVKCPKDRKNNILILHKNLDENTAFEYEIGLIKMYGRKDINPSWGILRNRTNGGDGIPENLITEEAIKRKSERFKGENNPMFGKHISEATRKILSEANKGENNYQHNPKNWYHPEEGIVLNKTCTEMVELFPDRNLVRSGLSLVSRKIRPYHKGWICLQDEISIPSNIITQEEKRKDLGKRGDWYHCSYGEIKNTSATKLSKKFPELNLCSSSLSKVLNGKVNHHKGWIKLQNKGRYQELVNPVKGIFRDWYHPDYGLIEKVTASQLSQVFPDLFLKVNSLNDLANGKFKTYKGWTFKGQHNNN